MGINQAIFNKNEKAGGPQAQYASADIPYLNMIVKILTTITKTRVGYAKYFADQRLFRVCNLE